MCMCVPKEDVVAGFDVVQQSGGWLHGRDVRERGREVPWSSKCLGNWGV